MKTDFSRRHFLKQAPAVGMAFASLGSFSIARAQSLNQGLQLHADPKGLLDLPRGFSYRLLSETAGTMSDGFLRPGRPDGMACFAHPTDPGKAILMRNHENWPDTEHGSPFGTDDILLSRLEDGFLYDNKEDGSPYFGGVTKAIVDLRTGSIDEDFLVLVGTTGNCSGGGTPWGSWLSCEESTVGTAEGAGKPHGFVFEVPSSASKLIAPSPLTAMGRFAHEAAEVDPDSGYVYMTEDARFGLFYRFIPDVPGSLERGGRLQALSILSAPGINTSNWALDWGGGGLGSIPQGHTFEVKWIDLDDVEAPDGDLAQRGHAAGAAQFCRGEGMAFGRRPGSDRGEVFFNCTQGGGQRAGQVWRLTPGAGVEPDRLTLLYESTSPDRLDLCDNLALAPWGDLLICEDGLGDQFLRGLTPDGRLYDLARNAHPDRSEFCGACFSPDWQTLFVNVQEPGFTYAITGPWEKLASGRPVAFEGGAR